MARGNRHCIELLVSIAAVWVGGCSEADLPAQNAPQMETTTSVSDNFPTREEIEAADWSVLFIGNSHSRPIPDMLAGIFARSRPEEKILLARVPAYGFLADHVRHPATHGWIERGPWKAVVLQAQKYSTSGRYEYPIDGALQLAGKAREADSRVLMYPEWSRRGQPEEYLRINAIHERIAQQTGARVAPIGQAWAHVQREWPGLNLYAADGNHASPAGSYLVACVFYSMLTGEKVSPVVAAVSGNQPLSASEMNRLQDLAWQIVKAEIESGQD